MAVNLPGGTLRMIAASRSSAGARPLCWISASWLLRQLSFVSTRPLLSWSSSTGSWSAPGTGLPFAESDGPSARTMMRLNPEPFTIQPPMGTLSPDWANTRPEMFASSTLAGVGLGLGVAVGVLLGVGVTIGVALGVALADGVGVTVALGVGVGVPVAAGSKV